MDFNATYHQYYADVLYLAMHYLHNQQDAEDIAQEVFLKLWQNIDRTTDKTVLAFLRITTRNACYDKLKATKRWVKNTAGYRPEETEDTEDAEVKAAVINRLYTEVQKLNKRPRRVILLYLQGLRPGQIAKRLRKSVQTVMNQHCAAVKELREVMN